ncbi:MAG: HD domain-containing protein [Myxococcales bacterium]|nr:HD domain-containing protein [Myxococcales bacterium]
MRFDPFRVSLFDLLAPLAKTVDLMSAEVAQHHERVAYLCLRLAQELNWSEARKCEAVTAALLHDIGAFSILDRLALLRFEEEDTERHCIAGALLLADFPPLANAATIVRHHHANWRNGPEPGGDPTVPPASYLIYLADRAAVLLDPQKPVLAQAAAIAARIREGRGTRFAPEMADAFASLARRDYFWLEAATFSLEQLLKRDCSGQDVSLGLDELLAFAKLLCRIIDFKSEFTATHSSGVAAVAVALGLAVGFSDAESKQLQVAAFLHDLGKLAVPAEILEKAGRLTDEERFVMRTHVFHTYRILDPIPMLRQISDWGSLHQERLNGSGYPFGRQAADIPLGARILAVADVFTALAENRPYRIAMSLEEVTAVLREMAAENELDESLVERLLADLPVYDRAREAAQRLASQEYQSFHLAL